MDKFTNFWRKYWKVVLFGLGISTLGYLLLFFNLEGLTKYYATTEIQSQQQSIKLSTIQLNPINAPYKLIVWAGLKLDHHSILVTRVAAASIALLLIVMFYWVALHWYSRRVAFLSTLLFATSSGFLHFGRYGTALIAQMATLFMISGLLLYQKTKHETLAIYLLVVVLASCLYLPGIFWFALVGLWFIRRGVITAFKKMGRLHSYGVIALCFILIAPLALAAIQDPGIVKDILGLPRTAPTPYELYKNTLHLASSLFIRGYWPPQFWLYGAPLLNITEAALLVIGLSRLIKRPILRVNCFLLAALTIGSILIIIGGGVTVAVLIPLIYLTIARGIYHLIDDWLTIFPRNPIAKHGGLVLLSILVIFSILYHLQAYFVAWPHSPSTRAVYTMKQPDWSDIINYKR